MKKTYMKPTSEAMRLGLQGDVLDGGINVMSIDATSLGTKIDGGDALVGAEKDWDDSSNFWGD